MQPESFLQRIALAWVAHATLAGAFALVAFTPAPALAVNSNTEIKLTRIASQRVEAKYGRASPEWRQDVPRTAVPGSAAGSMVLVDVFKGPSPANGEIIDVEVKRVIPWSSAARATANALPFVSTAVALLELTEAIRCREGFGLTWECDAGVPPALQQLSGVFIQGLSQSHPLFGVYFPSHDAACDAAFEVPHVLYLCSPDLSVNGSTCACGRADGLGNGIGVERGGYQANGCVGGVPTGPDGQCPSGNYTPRTPSEVAEIIEEFGDKDKAPEVVDDLSGENIPMEHDFPDIDPETPVQGPRETTTNPDGSTTVRDTRWDLTGQGPGYTWTPTVTEQTFPPGATVPPPGQLTGGTTTTGSGAPNQEVITCGLPDTPACKIDETDTPEEVEDTSETDVQGVMAPILEAISNPAGVFGEFPTINWTFALPTGCGVIPLSAFEPYLTGIDICQFQPVFHDVMAVVWVLGALFGAIGIFWRDQLAT